MFSDYDLNLQNKLFWWYTSDERGDTNEHPRTQLYYRTIE